MNTLAIARTFAALLAGPIALGGCTTVKQSFPGHDAGQVWAAMVTVAEHPHYDDWTITLNDVRVDEGDRLIEVDRHLRRVLVRVELEPWSEERIWVLQISLVERDPPLIKFLAEGVNVPAHVWSEADLYFADVRDVLAELPADIVIEPQDQALLDALGLDEEPPPDD